MWIYHSRKIVIIHVKEKKNGKIILSYDFGYFGKHIPISRTEFTRNISEWIFTSSVRFFFLLNFFFFFGFETAYGYQWLFNRWHRGSEVSMYMIESFSLSLCPHICQKISFEKWERNYNDTWREKLIKTLLCISSV